MRFLCVPILCPLVWWSIPAERLSHSFVQRTPSFIHSKNTFGSSIGLYGRIQLFPWSTLSSANPLSLLPSLVFPSPPLAFLWTRSFLIVRSPSQAARCPRVGIFHHYFNAPFWDCSHYLRFMTITTKNFNDKLYFLGCSRSCMVHGSASARAPARAIEIFESALSSWELMNAQ